jgi:hypothetical protein
VTFGYCIIHPELALDPDPELKFYANAEGKRPKERQPLLVQYKHQANPLLSMNKAANIIKPKQTGINYNK